MAFEIREARPEEYEAAGRVTADAYREFIRPGSDWAGYLRRIEDVGSRAARTVVLVAIDDDRILGSLTLELDGRAGGGHDRAELGPDEAHIRMLGVDPASRRRGVARSLMAASEVRALGAGKRRITLNTGERMEAARALYEGLGFRRLPDEVFPDGFTMLAFEKPLGASVENPRTP